MVGTCLLSKENFPFAIIKIISTLSKYFLKKHVIFTRKCLVAVWNFHFHFFKMGTLNMQHAGFPAIIYQPKNKNVLLSPTNREQV